jgi:phosphoribosylcarboxyaminoimidazole (NCAIR) mutase
MVRKNAGILAAQIIGDKEIMDKMIAYKLSLKEAFINLLKKK